MISGDQCRAARALLKWSLAELAEKVGIREQAISKFENGDTEPLSKNIRQIQTALEDGGVEFLPTGGVQPKQGELRVYKGRSGFLSFIDDVYETVKKDKSVICVSNVNEADFEYWLGEYDQKHIQRMEALEDLSFKILTQENDTNVSSIYAEYRWVPKTHFSSVPFYVYGNKLAIILFKGDVSVYVVENADIADAQRLQFNLNWEEAGIPVIRKGRN